MTEDKISQKKIRFATLFPGSENVHLAKDVGMIPYILGKYYNYESKLVCYKNGDYPYLNAELKGLNIDFIKRDINSDFDDGTIYLIKNSRNIDVLHLFHLSESSLKWMYFYKKLNPNGRVYLKLDANTNIINSPLNEGVFEFLKRHCSLISVETKYLYQYLNKNWPVNIEYIPNGFYNFCDQEPILYNDKENIICTSGNIGFPVKANEILLKAFELASPYLTGWKLKMIGPIKEEFKQYIIRLFLNNPRLQDQIIFTGQITNKCELFKEYKKAKIFCLTSKIEGFPLVFPEAARNGCFIVSSNLPAAWDITDNKKYGDIFEIEDIKQLALLLINNCKAEERLKSVCKDIQTFAYENFYWVNICKKINYSLTEDR
ncbi:MAG: glycosyltransferase [Firmicutes bacterium]|nr:glycosyltransferase [Bacillota bacterium]